MAGTAANNWEAKDQWRACVNFDLPLMVDYNFKGNTGIRRLLDHWLVIFYVWTPCSIFIIFASQWEFFFLCNRTDESRRTALARNGSLFFLSYLSLVAAWSTIPTKEGSDLLFHRV